MTKCARCRREAECGTYTRDLISVSICDRCEEAIILEWAIKKLDVDIMKES